MLSLNNITKQDLRALCYFFAIALLSATGLAFGMFFASDFQLGKRHETPPLPASSVKPVTPTQR